jgi:hypothetical protein
MPGDEDGFISRECPTCLQRFKAQIVEGSVATHFCAYCGHAGDDCWWTPEQLDYAKALTMQQLIEPELEAFAREMESTQGSFLNLKVERSVSDGPVVPSESVGPEELHIFPCCGAKIKFESRYLKTSDGGEGVLTCVQCGTPDTGQSAS